MAGGDSTIQSFSRHCSPLKYLRRFRMYSWEIGTVERPWFIKRVRLTQGYWLTVESIKSLSTTPHPTHHKFNYDSSKGFSTGIVWNGILFEKLIYITQNRAWDIQKHYTIIEISQAVLMVKIAISTEIHGTTMLNFDTRAFEIFQTD